MNDSFSGKNGKVKVMYVRSDDDNRSTNGKKNERKGGRNERSGAGGQSRGNSGPSRTGYAQRGEGSRRDHGENRRQQDNFSTSPWKTVSHHFRDEQEADHGGISGKSAIDPEQLRRQRAEETRVYGENACQALFASRPEAIVRAWFLQSVTPRFREALRWMAANRKAYHVVDEQELAKASGTEHHGGVCFLIKKRQGLDVATYLKHAPEKDCILALGGIGNPHNLGAIVRSCAHFGVQGVLLPDPAQLESGAAVRTAEGGAEHIKAINADDFLSVINSLREAGYTIISTSHRHGVALTQCKLPAKMVLLLGQEQESQNDSAWQQGDQQVFIAGSGKVESLNPSVAAGIFLADWWRQHLA
ncbi:tRNA/rRNA methyltransferase [Serratia microhaemolytica]|uniref:tRNA/rRNA methyltransferase n=1 Tax=Serratia microhaemolytica TaxID=2675110 RepID=UPI000FDE5933|nr:tRNA/rRNA methyltransferase [Serratia microhaemolytica]